MGGCDVSGNEVQLKRLRRALAAVFAAAALLAAGAGAASFLWGAGVDRAEGGIAGTVSLFDAVWGRLNEGSDLAESLEGVGLVPVSGANAPTWLEDEVMPRAVMGEAVATPDWSTIGFAMRLPPDEALDELMGVFLGQGWRECESGVAGLATLTKERGTCTWMMVSCSAVADETSVVLQIRHG